jgi:hypothetical protein
VSLAEISPCLAGATTLRSSKMNSLLLLPACIAAFVGGSVGVLSGYCLRSPRAASVSLVVAAVLAALAWVTYGGGLIYWHASVEPRLDGSEGSGVGFGWVLIHVWGAAFALLFTGVLLGLRLSPGRHRKKILTNKPCDATCDNVAS